MSTVYYYQRQQNSVRLLDLYGWWTENEFISLRKEWQENRKTQFVPYSQSRIQRHGGLSTLIFINVVLGGEIISRKRIKSIKHNFSGPVIHAFRVDC